MRAVSLLTMGLSLHSLTAEQFTSRYSEFDRSCGISTCQDLPVLYPPRVNLTLAQKLFRREPAITRLDQLFTSYLKSSDSIARLNGSGLPSDFSKVHPAQDKLALASGLMYKTNALFTLGFPVAPSGKGLSLLHTSTRWLILQQARRDGQHAADDAPRKIYTQNNPK